jgi:hypothetical protein
MNTTRTVFWVRAIIITSGLFFAVTATAQLPPGFTGPPTNKPIASWSFHDQTNWTSDQGYLPISFTNLNYSWLGNGASLVVATNLPALLSFPIIEPSTGATNLVLNAPGSLMFWYAPADWSSASAGGTGPGDWAQLIDVGEWTTNASYGYWGLSVDPEGSNLWFVAQDGAGDTYGLSTPISWTTNYFHFVTLTYSSTNVSLYLDGQQAANDPGGLSIWPGSEVLSNGVFFGSDTNGQMEAQGLFNTVQTYAYPLSSNIVQAIFNWNYDYYILSPLNMAMAQIVSAPSTPSSTYSEYDIITGPGNLQQVGTVTAITSTNVWITNVVASVVGSGTNNMKLQFTIQGGFDGVPYDTFVNSVLDFSSNTNLAWSWQGQGFHGNTFVITNLPNTTCFLILGTPQDSDFDGLTDAYERLVSKTNPYNADTSGDGISDSDKILEGLNIFGYYPQWKLDSDDDSLPDAYESSIPGLSSGYAEPAPGLPSFSAAPIQ